MNSPKKLLLNSKTAGRHLLSSSAILLSLAYSLPSHAGVIVDISSAVAGTSQGFKPNSIIGKKNGYFGANLFTDNAESTDLTVEFLGSQAKWDVFFTLSNGENSWTIINHPDSASGVVKANDNNRQKGTITVGANQLIDFSFGIDVLWNGIGADYFVKNGSNTLPKSIQADNSGRYFWTGFEYDKSESISAIIFGLDDGGGWPTTDEDNDDLVIRISGFGDGSIRPNGNTEIPLPSGLVLFGSAISLAAIMRRKQQEKSTRPVV
jgi:hypothetical protein